MSRPEKLEELMKAAHNVVVRDGIARLTLELVAREAGVSKGAVLYYFPTKSDLIAAMMNSHLDGHDRELEALVAQEPEGVPGRRLRALIRMSRCPDEVAGRGGAGMLAAVANDKALLAILRERVGGWLRDLDDDGLDPVHAQTIRLAIDGLKFSEMMDVARPAPEMREKVIDHLLALATPPAPGGAKP